MPLAPLQQTSDYAQALTAMGVTVSMAQQVTLNRRLPLLGTVRYIPRGRWPEGQADHTLIVNAADAGADLGLASQGALPITTPQWLAVLNLTGTEADLLARMRGKWRNRLRAAQKGPLVLHHARFDRHKHAWLLEQETRQRRERGYAALPHAVLAHFPSENTLVIHAT
jgi:lipid II:glycine glycyltransferase (peptidoglycan interpeptide bridge formation enzyme)